MIKLTRTELMPGVGLTVAHTDMFKSGYLSVHLITKLSRQTASMAALLPGVLLQGTVDHPNEDSIAAAANAVGAGVPLGRTSSVAELHDICLYISFPDDAALAQRPRIAEKAAELLGQIVLSPRRSGGRLHGAYVDKAKEQLSATLSSLNDPIAVLKELMCRSEAYGTPQGGTDSGVKRASVGTLTPYYRRLIRSARVELFYCGSLYEERLLPILRNAFSALPPREPEDIPPAKVRYAPVKDVRYFDGAAMDSASVVVGCRLGEAMHSPDPAVLSVLARILSLPCGDVNMSCFADDIKGVLFIHADCAAADQAFVLSAVRERIASVAAGDISPEQLLAAKTAAISSVKNVQQDQMRLDGYFLRGLLAGRAVLPGDFAAMTADVSAQKVSAAAACIKEDSVLTLS